MKKEIDRIKKDFRFAMDRGTHKKGGISSFVGFVRAIKGKGYSNDIIKKTFKLVSWQDWKGSRKDEILKWLKLATSKVPNR